MKKWLLVFFLSTALFATPIQERKLDPVALRELATELGISPEDDLVAATQKQWLRKQGHERWEVDELSSEKGTFVLNWAKKQELFTAWKPLWICYDHAVILGATTSRMQMRLNYLKELWESGTRFHQVIWLTGDRPLDARVDCLTDRCKTETEAARIIWEETSLPEEMRQISVDFIATAMKGQARPNTKDTLITWLQKAPAHCSALFISNQPFCGYQYAVIDTYLPESIQFDVVGPTDDPENNPIGAAILLDSIARWIYQESLKNH